MSIRRKIARWLGYGGIEWPRSGIVDMRIKFVDDPMRENADILRVMNYPGGIQVLPREFGCDGRYRLLLRGEVGDDLESSGNTADL